MNIMNNVIHTSANADFSGYTYVKVYAGAGATPTINGVTVTMIGGCSIEILVQSISGTNDVYVIGYKKVNAPLVING